MKGKKINTEAVRLSITIVAIFFLVIVVIVAYGPNGTIEKLEKKISKLKIEAESQKKEIADLRIKLNNCPGNLEAAKLENSKLKEQLGGAADNLEKLKTSLKNLLSPARKIVKLCDAVDNMCLLDKAKLLKHINSLRVHVAPGE